MHRLEGVDVAVRLIEVAILVVVVAVPDVELGQISVNLRGVLPAAICAAYQPSIESWRKFHTWESGLSS
jgi:hypothetical protein